MNKENSRFRIAVVDDDELFARKICRISFRPEVLTAQHCGYNIHAFAYLNSR